MLAIVGAAAYAQTVRPQRSSMKNEYCDHIAYVLQNFERYDQRAFREFGGYLAYIALDVLESIYGLTPLQADAATAGTAEQLALPAAQLKHGS
jgi:hypothetical protein